ncbi:hypothetical protein AGMMS49975_17770 [Clostridia bacterium]|nr:hypothetical protein AGMMS49975_17770 [Clostridia bacterium]
MIEIILICKKFYQKTRNGKMDIAEMYFFNVSVLNWLTAITAIMWFIITIIYGVLYTLDKDKYLHKIKTFTVITIILSLLLIIITLLDI